MRDREYAMKEAIHGDWQELAIPVDAGLAAMCCQFWQQVFSQPYDDFLPLLAGSEAGVNDDRLFLLREGERLLGTARLTMSRSTPGLGGLGEVAVLPDARRRGIAGMLCACAREAFCRAGGRALFLATSNPAALRLYHRLGWRALPGTRAMLLHAGGESPETFLQGYFRDVRPVTVVPGSAADRIPMIPLIMTPHDWHLLDVNAGIYSTRFLVQASCMGLYPRYLRLREAGEGDWFSAYDETRRLLGLATLRRQPDAVTLVDVFAHPRHRQAWDALLQAVLHRAFLGGARKCQARVSVIDEEKCALFEAAGFACAGEDGEADFYGGAVPTLHYECRRERGTGLTVPPVSGRNEG